MNTDQKLERIAVSEYNRNLHNLIIATEIDEHMIFGAYRTKKHNGGITVYNRADDPVGHFSNQRSAVSFCVADKFCRYNLAQQIKTLDTKKQILDQDIACQRGLATRSKNPEFRELVYTKMSVKVEQHRAVNSELEKCINLAKYLQIKGFQNETARVFTI
jgi:hypothetical protein